MNRRKLLMTVAALAFTATAFISKPAHAQQAEVGSIAYLPAPALVDVEPAAGGDDTTGGETNRRQWARYFEYQHRENCQHYVEPPEGWVLNRCKLERVAQKQAMIESVTSVEPAAGGDTMAQTAPMQHPLTLYFDFDRADIRPAEQARLNETIADIKQANPTEVTVAGHADAAGTNAYNDNLSARRAQNVANALEAGGIRPSLIKQESFGERQLAVPTADGVPMQANRRVVVDFQTPAMQPGM